VNKRVKRDEERRNARTHLLSILLKPLTLPNLLLILAHTLHHHLPNHLRQPLLLLTLQPHQPPLLPTPTRNRTRTSIRTPTAPSERGLLPLLGRIRSGFRSSQSSSSSLSSDSFLLLRVSIEFECGEVFLEIGCGGGGEMGWVGEGGSRSRRRGRI